MADEVKDGDAANSKNQRLRQVARLIRQGVPLAVLAVVLLGVYLYMNRADHRPTPEHGMGPQGPMPVTAIVVEPTNVPLDWTYLSQTEASQTVQVRSRVSGFLLERTFEEGQHVEQGQVLYRVDPEPFEVTLAQNQAQLQAAQARLQRARQQVQRFETLATQQSAAAQELEQWQEELQVAAAEVELQKARIAQVELDIGYTVISAPISGVIGESLQDVGTYLSPTGDNLLATLRQVDPIYVRFSMSEQDLLRIRRLTEAGQVTDIPLEQLQVQVFLPDGRPHPHPGRLSFFDVAIDPSTGTALVRATVANPERSLRPGQYVTAHITGMERLDTVLVPQTAVIQSPTGAIVYVIDEQSIVQVRPVVLGEWYGDLWMIEGGLEAGDRVVVDHIMQARPGFPVEPTFVELTVGGDRHADSTSPLNSSEVPAATVPARPASSQQPQQPQ